MKNKNFICLKIDKFFNINQHHKHTHSSRLNNNKILINNYTNLIQNNLFDIIVMA